ncbi:MAG: glycosyltransferase [Cyanobacteria bacterium P01_H01_bin.21]
MSTVAEALQRAVHYQKSNNLEPAQRIYRQILGLQPGNTDALHGLSMVAQQKGRYHDAERLLKSILQIKPSSFKAWFSLGNVHQVQGHLQEAIDAYQKAIGLQPNAYPIFNNLGYVFQLQGKVDEAIGCYQQALQLQPHLPEAQVNLANVLYSQNKLSKEEKTHFSYLNYDLGINRHRAGDLTTAADYYRQAIALNPQLAAAHYQLGITSQTQGNLAEASSAYQNILALPQQNTSMLETRVHQKLRQIDQIKQSKGLNQKLKVAFVCQPLVMTVFPEPADSIGILTYELVKRLGEICEITVYAPGERRQKTVHDGVCYRYIPIKLDRGILKQLERFAGFNTSTQPSFASGFYYLGYSLQIGNELRKHHHDVVHIHNFSQFAPVIRALAPEIKIVLHMHCEWLNQLNQKVLEKRLRHVDLITTPSQYITRQVKQRFPASEERCLTLHNGVDSDRYLDFRSHDRNTQASSETAVKQLLFVGRVCPEKGAHVLLEAFHKVIEQEPTVQLTLIGAIGVIPLEYLVGLSDDPKVSALSSFHKDNRWDSYLRQWMLKFDQMASEDGTKPVTLTGLVQPSELPKFYRQADLFIFPSICHEAFGMPIAEAMTLGLPVIATRAGAIPELVEHGETGLLVERGDSDALAAAIVELLSDRERRQHMGQAGQQRAVQYFTFDKVASDLLHQYHHLCEAETTL